MVRWTAPAKLDLKDIYDYIAKDSKYYAQKISKDIVAKSEILKHFPKLGRVSPEIDDPNVREILVYSYRLIYEVLPNSVQVLALIHSRQNFTGKLDELKNREE